MEKIKRPTQATWNSRQATPFLPLRRKIVQCFDFYADINMSITILFFLNLINALAWRDWPTCNVLITCATSLCYVAIMCYQVYVIIIKLP